MSRTARRRATRLHLSLTGWTLTLFAIYVCARTWPIQTASTAIALALAGTVTVRRSSRARRIRGRGRFPIALPARLVRRIPRTRAPRATDLADYLALDPADFEHAIARLALRDPHVRSATPQGGSDDRGLDVLVRLHGGRRILIQCKRYGPRNRVTSEDVQKTNGTYRDIHGCDLAVIVTTSGYTRSAFQTNTMLARPLLLVDGQALMAWTAGGPPPWA
ncbi:restriction endonuclease [Streptomyces sp. NPDC059679]|uniref:restriction endonuclease n=1 Tax=Streptomyces sp. NPDC059679 TaxID=3346903 RepID=UPI0036C7807C